MRVETENRVGKVILGGEEISLEDITEIEYEIKKLEADREIDIILIENKGMKDFCIGHDIKELSSYDESRAKMYSARGQSLIRTMRNLKKIIISMVTGRCYGPGFEIVLASDIIFSDKTARFAYPEVNAGFLPGFGGTQIAARKVYETFVKYLVFTGEDTDSEEMYTKGFINKIFTDYEHMAGYVFDFCEKMSKRSSFAMGLAKETINNGADMDFDKALLFEQNAFTLSFAADDKKEGMGAFIEKRKPEFKNRWEDFLSKAE